MGSREPHVLESTPESVRYGHSGTVAQRLRTSRPTSQIGGRTRSVRRCSSRCAWCGSSSPRAGCESVRVDVSRAAVPVHPRRPSRLRGPTPTGHQIGTARREGWIEIEGMRYELTDEDLGLSTRAHSWAPALPGWRAGRGAVYRATVTSTVEYGSPISRSAADGTRFGIHPYTEPCNGGPGSISNYKAASRTTDGRRGDRGPRVVTDPPRLRDGTNRRPLERGVPVPMSDGSARPDSPFQRDGRTPDFTSAPALYFRSTVMARRVSRRAEGRRRAIAGLHDPATAHRFPDPRQPRRSMTRWRGAWLCRRTLRDLRGPTRRERPSDRDASSFMLTERRPKPGYSCET